MTVLRVTSHEWSSLQIGTYILADRKLELSPVPEFRVWEHGSCSFSDIHNVFGSRGNLYGLSGRYKDSQICLWNVVSKTFMEWLWYITIIKQDIVCKGAVVGLWPRIVYPIVLSSRFCTSVLLRTLGYMTSLDKTKTEFFLRTFTSPKHVFWKIVFF